MPKDAMTKVTYDAPIGSIDLMAFRSDGSSYEFRACSECLPWHAEVVIDPRDDTVMVREWHAVGCSFFQELLAQDDDPDDEDE